MKLRELINREWRKSKKTREQNNKRIFTGRRRGQFYENGKPRGLPRKFIRR